MLRIPEQYNSYQGLVLAGYQEYDIDGVFMQRFIHQLTDPRVENHYDTVFESAIHAAKKSKRAISIRYDLTQLPGQSAAESDRAQGCGHLCVDPINLFVGIAHVTTFSMPAASPDASWP